MHRNRILKRTIALMVTINTIITMSPIVIKADDGITEIKIYHTNDTHSRAIEKTDKEGILTNIGFAKFKEFIDRDSQNADGKLVLDAGDTFHGQAFATLEEGKSIANVLKTVGYEAISPGNHDFNYGKDKLHSLAELAGVKVLAGNVHKNDGSLEYEDTLIKEIDGVKIGVFGLASNETPHKTNPNNVVGLDFGTDEEVIEDTQEMVDNLEEAGCDIIVGLTHVGVDDETSLKSTDIAKKVDGIDLIIDGHSHTNLSDYEKIDGTVITATGEYFENAGVIDIKYDTKNDKLLEITPKEISAKDFTNVDKNTEVSNLIDSIQTNQEKILNEVIGSTPTLLDGERTSVRFGHTNLGRLVADSMKSESNADISITNGGGIRASIDSGDITKGEILTVLPFGNYIVTLEVSGEDIINALNHGFEVGAGKFPHYSGMDVKVKEIKDGETTKYEVVSVKINGEDLQKDKMYTVATNDFMAVGGDEYEMFKDCKRISEYASLDEALIKYIEVNGDEGIQSVENENRLIIEKNNEKVHWAQNDLQELKDNGYLEGFDNIILNNSISYEEFIKLSNKVLGLNEVVENNKVISREEAAKIIVNAKKLKGDGVLNFKDNNKITELAKPYIDAISDNNIMNGYEDNTFKPDQTLTFAEAIVILNRVK